jgi:hypothetical protein
MKPEDRMNAAKSAMAMRNLSKTGAPKANENAQKMMEAGREEATQASKVGASKTTIDEKTGKKMTPMAEKIKKYNAD